MRAHFRLETRRGGTEDEYAALLHGLFTLSGYSFQPGTEAAGPGISAGIIATVVPPVLRSFEELFRRYLKLEPVVVGPGTRTGMPVLYDNPKEVGADRIVNGVAAYERHGAGCLVVIPLVRWLVFGAEFRATGPGHAVHPPRLLRTPGERPGERRSEARAPLPRCRPADR